MNIYRDCGLFGSFDVAYAIYYSGNDAAIVWDNSVIAERVIKRFVELLGTDGFGAGERFVETGKMTVG
jgi:phosphoribosylformylglycinamidine (FGAM) synthase-like amidotransferase family enzyme